MKSLIICCPYCNKKSELFLASNPSMMVLNCPVCQATLMHLDGETHQIDDLQIVNLEKNMLRQYVKNLKQKQLSAPNSTMTPTLPAPKPNHQMGQALGQAPPTEDDIINLKIDLALCDTVDDFLDRF